MTEASESRIQFENCELDTASRRFWRDGELVALQPRVFDLLAFLIAGRDRALGKDDIQDGVWGGVIVTETALTRAIMKARRAVGDDAEKQAIIRTVHGHGYQFVAQIKATPETLSAHDESAAGPDDNLVAESQEQGSSVATTAQSGLSVRKLRWVVAGIAAVIFVSIAVLWKPPVEIEGLRIAVMPVANETGNEELNWAKLGLMGFANDLISNATDLQIVSAADVVSLVDGIGWSGKIDSGNFATSIETLRRAYGASHILVSQLQENAGALRLSYSLLNPDGEVTTGTMVGKESTELVRGMVHSISERISNRRHLQEQFPLGADDPFINEAYARAMSFSLEGRCADALPLFEVVTKKETGPSRAGYEHASCLRISGKWKEAEAAYGEMLNELTSESPNELKAHVLVGLGIVFHRTGRLDEAADTYALALQEANESGATEVKGKTLNSLALIAKDRRKFDEARDLLARATTAYGEAGRDLLPGQIFSALANIDMREGKLSHAEENLDLALNSFRTLGDRRNEAMMLNNYGYLRRIQGRFEEAEPLHLESLKIRKAIGDTVGQGRILGMLSTLYTDKGRYEDAQRVSTEAIEIARVANDRLFLGTGLAQLAAAERHLGNLDVARSAYIESLSVFTGLEDHMRAAQVQLRLAGLDLMTENFAAADARIADVLDETLAAELQETTIEAMIFSGNSARQQDKTAEAVSWYKQALALIEETGFTANEPATLVKLTNLLLDNDDTDAAEPLLGKIMVHDKTPDSLKVQARYAFMTHNVERSVKLMEQAKELAKEAWSEEDSQTLAIYSKAL